MIEHGIRRRVSAGIGAAFISQAWFSVATWSPFR